MNNTNEKKEDKSKYLQAITDMNYLIYCIVNGQSPDKEKVNKMNLEELFKAADNHMLTSITAMGLESAGVNNYNFNQALGNAVRKNGTLDIEKSRLFQKLEENGIWYMPLKGSVMKDYYPKYGMRQMSDIDVLFDSRYAEKVREIMEDFGFTTIEFGNGHHDVYLKKPVSNFEMHWELFGTYHDKRLNDYYKNTKDRLIKDSNNKFGYHFSNEDFYIFMLAHEYKHYAGLGTGLRSVLDVYMFMKKFGDNLNMNYIERELNKIGIGRFERQMRNLAENLYGKNIVTLGDREMYDFIVSVGVYGSVEGIVSNRIRQIEIKGFIGKLRYIWIRLFPPVEILKQYYPQFFEHKILIPLLLFYRLSKIFTVKKDFVRSELKLLFKYKQ